MFGLAMIAAIARTIIRIRRFHKIAADDWALFCGVFLLVPGTVLLFVAVQPNYNEGKGHMDPGVKPIDLLRGGLGMSDSTLVVYAFP